jgi:hypothetical protein
LPDSISKLKKLQWLMLEHNQLTGLLPTYLGQLPQLQRVLLQHNSLSGPVPISLCSGSSMYDLASNVGLCGECTLQAATCRLRVDRSQQAAAARDCAMTAVCYTKRQSC